MSKKFVNLFMVFFIMMLFSIFMHACTKNIVTEDKLIEPNIEELSSTDDTSVSAEDEDIRLNAEQEQVKREARLKEDALKAQKEKEEADKIEAMHRKEFEKEDVYFNYDSAVLDESAQNILKNKAVYLEKNSGISVNIEGYCDERGTNEYNLVLGEKRAQSVKNFLIKSGILFSRLKIISYGEEAPLDSGHNEASWAKNRRAHFKINYQTKNIYSQVR
ncbi:MAG: peptidoglycan-associated lipoprotein Pal [Proteobacteria bacterium]|nr:peptidoglycan-associated lipoprotein Pal [Pseudomonadota bacterium]